MDKELPASPWSIQEELGVELGYDVFIKTKENKE